MRFSSSAVVAFKLTKQLTSDEVRTIFAAARDTLAEWTIAPDDAGEAF